MPYTNQPEPKLLHISHTGATNITRKGNTTKHYFTTITVDVVQLDGSVKQVSIEDLAQCYHDHVTQA